MTTARAFRGFRFPAEVILWAVRWYLQFPISYRDLEAMLADRGARWITRPCTAGFGSVALADCGRALARFPSLRPQRRRSGVQRLAAPACHPSARHAPVPGQHRHCLDAGQRPLCRPEALKAEHEPGQALDPAVILLDPVIEPAPTPVPGEAPQLAFLLHLA